MYVKSVEAQCSPFGVVWAVVAEWYRYRIVACLVTGSSPVPLKTRRVGQRCTLNLSRAETSSRWCGVRRRRCQLRCRPRHLTMVQNDVAQSPRVAEQCDVTIQSINWCGVILRRSVAISSDRASNLPSLPPVALVLLNSST
ncbi:uncharacterized protein TNCV_3404461 [Trichonephila clavipes]|nr:uncharacterized protein TNCV_3404461 [Trichonephila clavipes]